MLKQNAKEKYGFILVFFLNLLVLINSYFQGVYIAKINFAFAMFCWLNIYIYNKKAYNHETALIRLLILSVPLSFTDIWGSFYGNSMISWFNIFFFIIVITYLIKYLALGNIFFNVLSVFSLLLIMISFIPVLISVSFFGALKQYINIIVSFILIIIGNSFKYNMVDHSNKIFKKDYIIATLVTALALYIQVLLVQLLDIQVGNYKLFSGNRHAYGFLFTDYSFLSLYLASGAILLYSLKDKCKFKKGWSMCFLFMLIASILTSARTGIVAFIVTFMFFNTTNILKFMKRGSAKFIIVFLEILVNIFLGFYLVAKTRGIAMFSDSGRMALNRRAMGFFMENPIWGIGFGKDSYIGMIPHNLLFQYLAQGGLLFVFPLLCFLLMVLWMAFKKDKELMLVLMCILLGSFFIPNVFNSRFLPVLFLILSVQKNIRKTKGCEKHLEI